MQFNFMDEPIRIIIKRLQSKLIFIYRIEQEVQRRNDLKIRVFKLAYVFLEKLLVSR